MNATKIVFLPLLQTEVCATANSHTHKKQIRFVFILFQKQIVSRVKQQ